jgi:DNA-binding transcriptional LysR family regulator
MNLSVKHLRAFQALAKQRNFTRAASACNLSQPAFSALIQGLEEDTGVRLFDRNTRRVDLTHEGRIFEQSAARLLADAKAAYSELKDHIALRKGRVAIAALPSLAAGSLPPLLAAFHQQHPGIRLELFDLLSDTCIAQVQAGTVDFALAPAGAGSRPGLQTELLCSDRFHVVCPAEHPLARQRAVKAAQLAGHPFIHLARSTSIRQHLERALHPLALDSMLEVEQLATVAALVAQGLGISVIPALALAQFRQPGVVVKPLQLAGLQRHIHIIRLEGRSLPVAAQALLDMVRAGFAPRARRAGP